MNSKAALTILLLFLGVGGAVSYHQVATSGDTGAVVMREGNDYAVNYEAETVIEVEMYYYAAETYDKVLVPLAFASERITNDDIERFVLITETVFPQIEYEEADKGVEIMMLHLNREGGMPVWVEVIRVGH